MDFSFIQGIIYQQPLLNEDLGSASDNTTTAFVGDFLSTPSDSSTYVQNVANLSTVKHERDTKLGDRSSTRTIEMHGLTCQCQHLCLH